MFSLFSKGYFQVPCWVLGVYIPWGSGGELRDKQLYKHCHNGEKRRELVHDRSWRELIHASKIHQSHLRFYLPSAKTELLWHFDIQKRVADIFGKSSLLLLPWFKTKKSPCTVATIDSWGVAFRSCSGCLPQTGTTCQSCQHGEPCEAQVKPITRMCKQCGCKKNPLEEQKKHSRGGWLTKQSIVTKAPWTKPRSVETVFKIPQIIYIYTVCLLPRNGDHQKWKIHISPPETFICQVCINSPTIQLVY